MTPSQSAHRRDRRRRNGYCMALASGSGVADLWTPRSPLLPSLETRYLRNEPNRAWPWPFQLISLHKRNFNLSLGHGNSSRRVRWILRWVAKKRPLIVLVEQFRIIRFPLFSPSCLARLKAQSQQADFPFGVVTPRGGCSRLGMRECLQMS